MKNVFKRVSAAVTALAVAATAVVFDVPGKLIAAAVGESAQAEHASHKVCCDLSCDDSSHTEITDWTPISDASGFSSLTDGEHYYLTAPVTLTDEVTINENKDITLCLNGQTLTAASGKRIFTIDTGSLTLCDCGAEGRLTGGNSAENGGAVYVKSGGFYMYGGAIYENQTTQDYTGGGGVYVNKSGRFIMYGGTISKNHAYGNGSGVYVSSEGTFTMNGGTISENTPNKTSNTYGGGVYVYGSSSSVAMPTKFTMNGGTIYKNTANYGGGVCVNNSGTFTMSNGTILENTATSNGGGVYVKWGTFTMSDGSISNNNATSDGGGVSLDTSGTFELNGGTISENKAINGAGVDVYGKTFTMNNGTISKNVAGSFGGGVNAGGTFTMKNGTISENTASYGGGVNVSYSETFTMEGGTISGNTVISNYGGGVYNQGTVTLNGNVTITGNTKENEANNNVYLCENRMLTIGADFSTDSPIGVVTYTEPTVDTPVDIATGVTGDVSSSFKADEGTQEIVYNTSESKLQLAVYIPHKHGVCGVSGCTDPNHPAGHDTDITWTKISNENGLKAMTDGGHYYLAADITLTDQVQIASGVNVTLCLNGQTITAAENKRIFEIVGSTLTLCDCGTEGKLTGGNVSSGNGGAVHIKNSGTFNMYGGEITKNTAENGGGGVSVLSGIFNMYGGKITDNSTGTGGVGGGVYNTSTFNMYGGTISGNFGKAQGGGVYSNTVSDGVFNMCGGEIIGNKSNYGGGVYNFGDIKINNTVKITGNFGWNDDSGEYNVPNNVYLYIVNIVNIVNQTQRGKPITLGDNFSTNSVIGVTHCDYPTCSAPVDIATGENIGANAVNSFVSDKEGYTVALSEDNKLQLTVPHNFENSEWEITKAPTTTETGTAQRTCAETDCTGTETKTLPQIDISGSGSAPENWTVEIQQPTMTEDGKIEYKDENGEVAVTVVIPAINTTDSEDGTSVWTKAEVGEGENQSKNPTLTEDGTFVYTSEDYGTIEVTVPALTDDTWTNTTLKPNISTGGKYTATSEEYGTITIELPALTDEDFWSKEETTLPTISTGGTYTYKSDYCTVTAEVPALTDDAWTRTETTKPTVSESGEYTYTSDYGTVTVEVPALTDDTWTKTETTKPTISESGEYTYTSDYGTLTVEVPALTDDTWTKTETTKPTISESGEYTYTSDYGTLTVEVPALTDDTWTRNETTKPTISESGEYTYTSDYGTVTVEVPALTDDTWTKTETTKPTISESGEYTYTSDYGTVTVEVPKLSDSTVWTRVDSECVPATEDEDGKDVYRSAYGTVEVIIPKLSHTHEFAEAWSKDDTYHWHAATCGHTDVVKDKAAHVWNSGEITKAATATESGVRTFTCTVCEATKTEEIPALGNDCGANLTWSYDETTKTLTISGTGDMYDWTEENPAPWADKVGEIENVVIDDGVTSIGDNAFKDCTELTEVTIPDSVTEIGNGAFEGCTSLAEIIIPEGVEIIGDNAFAGCTSLTEITIPETVAEIGDNAFEGCTDLETITFEGENPPAVGSDVFKDCPIDKIVVPEGSEDAYKDEGAFEGLTDKITDNSGSDDNGNKCGDNLTWSYDETTKTLTISGTGDMYDWTEENPAPWADKVGEIENVVIDDGVTSIGDNAFKDCTELTDVTIPETVTEIGNGAFEGCTSLAEIIIPEGVEIIGDNAFAGCISLKEITIPETVAEIGDNAFEGCTDLETVTFEGENPPAVGSDVFKDCPIDKIVVPKGSEDAYKDEGAFEGLTDKITDNSGSDDNGNKCGDNLTWSYDETTKTLTISGTGDMYDWTEENPAPWADKVGEIENVVIDDGVTSIGDNAFKDCTELTEVTIPETVTEIGNGAFEGCTSLAEIIIPEGVEIIGDNAFAGCISLKEITIPETVAEIGDNAFEGCTDLETITFEGENPPAMGSDVFKDCPIDKIVVPEGSEDAYKDEGAFEGLTDKITDNNNGSDPEKPDDPENPGNPPTGIAISLIPLVAAAATLAVVIKRKKK